MHRLILAAAMTVVASAQIAPVAILTEAEVQQLELKVAQNPADRASQKLLGQNYAMFVLGITELGQYDRVTAVDAAKANSAFAKHAREQLGSTLLATVAGEGGRTLWSESTQVESFRIVHHVQEPLPIAEARALAIASIDRAVSLEPATAKWRTYRIPILIFRSDFPKVQPLTPAEAYAQVKQDVAALKGQDRVYMLGPAAKLAFKADALDDAAAYAREMLEAATGPNGWDTGNEIFFGNMVLGEIALKNGDKEKAKAYLIASSKTIGSPQLNSFGPNMSLAKALAEAGERQAVIDFFAGCKAFWKMDRGQLQKWSAEVSAGTIPQFGANLVY